MFKHLRTMVITCLIGFAPHAQADQSQDTEALYQALHLSDVIGIMRQEGLAYGADLAQEMLPGGMSPAFRNFVSDIYDTEKMERVVKTDFAQAIGQTDVTPLLGFFQSAAGQRVTSLELEARRAFMNKETEKGARERFRGAEEQRLPRVAAIGHYIESNDLIDYNVSGALNANLMFFRGLVEAGGLEMSEEEILTEVWGQEQDTRDDTREWMFAYLLMAYQPLSDEEFAAYSAISQTPAGQVLNRALFAGFDRMYSEISSSLGLVTAQQMKGEDL